MEKMIVTDADRTSGIEMRIRAGKTRKLEIDTIVETLWVGGGVHSGSRKYPILKRAGSRDESHLLLYGIKRMRKTRDLH
jgi:hypothetical protein